MISFKIIIGGPTKSNWSCSFIDNVQLFTNNNSQFEYIFEQLLQYPLLDSNQPPPNHMSCANLTIQFAGNSIIQSYPCAIWGDMCACVRMAYVVVARLIGCTSGLWFHFVGATLQANGDNGTYIEYSVKNRCYTHKSKPVTRSPQVHACCVDVLHKRDTNPRQPTVHCAVHRASRTADQSYIIIELFAEQSNLASLSLKLVVWVSASEQPCALDRARIHYIQSQSSSNSLFCVFFLPIPLDALYASLAQQTIRCADKLVPSTLNCAPTPFCK